VDQQQGWIMDTAQANKIQIDLTDLWVDGHGDTFSISPGQWDAVNISHGSLAPGYGAVPPVSVLTWPDSSPTYSFSDLNITTPSSGRISLTGADADIEINGESVVGMLKDIRDRLNILQVSEQMEAEWDELRVMREQYEAKLAECREKSRAWAALKQQG
jgi:hypothetical protein